jgi:mono/diheme cytochrome c family protein
MKQIMQWIVNIWSAAALVGVIAAGIVALAMWSHGFNSRAQPPDMEANVAMSVHDSAIPGRYETMKNPLDPGSIDLVAAGADYEKHCADCHGDTGDGKTKFNGIMYPRPANLLSDDAREMSDGELYFVINQGIRYTGMPAFGKPGDDDAQAWKMDAYIRHLPKLTPAEEQQVLQQSQKSKEPAASQAQTQGE